MPTMQNLVAYLKYILGENLQRSFHFVLPSDKPLELNNMAKHLNSGMKSVLGQLWKAFKNGCFAVQNWAENGTSRC